MMMGSLALLLGVAAAIVGLDQWSKLWATAHLAMRPPVPVIGEFLQLTYTRNSGVAFGLGAGTGFPYYLFSIAAATVIVLMFVRRQVHGFGRQIALALILGGALGNLVDRLKTGDVVDFIQILWGRFPVFNVADSAVSVGVALFAWSWTRREYAAMSDGPAQAEHDDPNIASVRAGGSPGGAAGSLPGDGTDGPLP
jgi:signal peptidase II